MNHFHVGRRDTLGTSRPSAGMWPKHAHTYYTRSLLLCLFVILSISFVCASQTSAGLPTYTIYNLEDFEVLPGLELGAQAAVADINADSAFNSSFLLRLVSNDTDTSDQMALTQARIAVDAGAIAVAGFSYSAQCLAAASLQFPIVASNAYSPLLSNATRFPYFLRTNPTTDVFGVYAATALAKMTLPGRMFVAAYTEGDPATEASCNAFVQTAQQQGLVCLANYSLPKNPTNVSGLIALLQQSGVNIVYLSVQPYDLAVLLSALVNASMYYPNYQVISGVPVGPAFFLEAQTQSPRILQGGVNMFFSNAMVGGTPLYAQLNQTYGQLRARLPDPSAASASAEFDAAFKYDSIVLIARGIRAVLQAGGDPRNATALMAAMRNQSFTGASGPIAFRPGSNDVQAARTYQIQTVRANGDLPAVATGITSSTDLTLRQYMVVPLPLAANSVALQGGSFAFCTRNAVPNVDRTQCECEAGFYGNGFTGCFPCEPGTAAVAPGNRASCPRCLVGRYAPSAGAVECVPLPNGAVAINNGTGFLACSGNMLECTPTQIRPALGSFAILLNSSAVAGGGAARMTGNDLGVSVGGTGEFRSLVPVAFSCDNNNCLQPPPTANSTDLNPTTNPFRVVHEPLAEERGLVTGYVAGDNLCANGFSGFMCGACPPGMAQDLGRCVPCPGVQWGRLVGYFFGNWALVVVLHGVIGGVNMQDKQQGGQLKNNYLSLVIEFGQQVTNLVPQISFTLTSVLALFSLNVVDYASCTYPRDAYTTLLASIITPFGSALQYLLFYGLVTGLSRCFIGRPADIDRWLSRPLISLALASYMPITSAALQLIDCRNVGPYEVLTAAPAYLCYTARYWLFAAFACAALVVVSVGMPLAIGVLLYYWRTELHTPAMESRFGPLYVQYRPERFWWQLVSMSRRAVLVLLQLLPGFVQPDIWRLVLVYLMLMLQYAARPEATRQSKHMVLYMLLSLLLAATFSLGFVLVAGTDQPRVNGSVFVYAVLVVSAVAVIVMVAFTVRNYWADIRAIPVVLRSLWSRALEPLHRRRSMVQAYRAVSTHLSLGLRDPLLRAELAAPLRPDSVGVAVVPGETDTAAVAAIASAVAEKEENAKL